MRFCGYFAKHLSKKEMFATKIVGKKMKTNSASKISCPKAL
jgi:hypothetical protein